MTPHGKPKAVLGWTEFVDLPDWGIKALKAKVDTGARTSALHVENLHRLDGERVRFDVVLSRKKPDRCMTVEAPLVKRALVRSSTGDYSRRCFVKTKLRVAGVEKEIEVSLVSREKMLFRMLIGRKALEKDFIVDVSHRGERPKRMKPKIRKKKKLRSQSVRREEKYDE